ncbi:MAG: LamG domain-containing protein [Chthoniobacter sp.]|nr:LamG domain-containing protein [Chthoniobacter sp.]
MRPFPLLNASLALLVAAITSAQADNYKDAVLRDKPFAYYRLNETVDTEPVADEMGKNPGTFQNKPAVGGPGAIVSDSENRSVALARAQSQFIRLTAFEKFGSAMTGGFTVEYWLKTGNFTDHQTIFGAANGPGFITDFMSDIAYTGHTKLLRMYIRDNHEDRYEVEFYPGGQNIDIYDDAWHHIVQVYTPKAGGVNDRAQFYVDGIRQTVTVEHKARSRTNPVFSNFNQPLTLGAMNLRGVEQDYLDGSLDEVAFYTSVLSPEQILAHYRASGALDHLRVQR